MFSITRYCAAYSQSIYLSFKVKKRKFKANKLKYIYMKIRFLHFLNITKLALEGASRPSSKLIVNMFSLCSRIFTKYFVDFQNFQKLNEDQILMETNI